MPLELASIPQILKMLPLTKEEQDKALAETKKTGIFAGEAAVKLFPEKVSEELLKEKLLEQLVGNDLEGDQKIIGKANAALMDFKTIAEQGKQKLPKWPLKPQWGNAGVNKVENPTFVDGVSAAANIAANITLLANDKPELTKNDTIRAGMEASSKLALAIAGKSEPLTMRTAQTLMETSKNGLREAVAQSGADVPDLEEFIKARCFEIEIGVAQRIQMQLDALPKNPMEAVVQKGTHRPRVAFAHEPYHLTAGDRTTNVDLRRLSPGDIAVTDLARAGDELHISASGPIHVNINDAMGSGTSRRIDVTGQPLVVRMNAETLRDAEIKVSGNTTEITYGNRRFLSDSAVMIDVVNSDNKIAYRMAARDIAATMSDASRQKLEMLMPAVSQALDSAVLKTPKGAMPPARQPVGRAR